MVGDKNVGTKTVVISLKEVIEAIPAMNKINTTNMPVKVGYKLSKNINLINAELSIYEEQRSKLLHECALKDEKGELVCPTENQLTIDPEKMEKWKIENENLGNIPIDISHLNAITIDDLEQTGCLLTPVELQSISFMIID